MCIRDRYGCSAIYQSVNKLFSVLSCLEVHKKMCSLLFGRKAIYDIAQLGSFFSVRIKTSLSLVTKPHLVGKVSIYASVKQGSCPRGQYCGRQCFSYQRNPYEYPRYIPPPSLI